jgi:magnesium-transporting ATPase (P-type)
MKSPSKTNTTRRSKEHEEGTSFSFGFTRVEPAGSLSDRMSASHHSESEGEGLVEEVDPLLRSIAIGVPNLIQKDEYCNNAVVTAKYNVFTFLPIFLFKMFSRVAYVYFLFQATLSWWGAISPYNGLGPTAGLVFVLSVAAIKEIIEDKKRHEADLKLNTSVTRVLQEDGSFSQKEWQQLRVGDIVQVNDDDLLPADLLCLHTALPDNVCFIKTANLDGESNLKIKRPITLLEDASDSATNSSVEEPSSPPLTCPSTFRRTFMPGDWMRSFEKFNAFVHVEGPTPNLQTISGQYVERRQLDENLEEEALVPITMNEMLLRGCMLKNSGFVLGMVVYTGKETRIQMNNRSCPFKLGSLDTYLNMQIILLLFLQFSVCLGCALAALVWRRDQGMFGYYLAFDTYSWDGNNENPFLFVLLNLITNWILYSFMIPISLFVSNEIVKFWQTFIFINKDKEMIDEETKESARARNSNVVEDLAKINYVFSDKTGTLTSNEMRLRCIGIGGLAFGSRDKALELNPELQGREALQFFDDRLAMSLDAQKSNTTYPHSSEDHSKYDYVTVSTKGKEGEHSINFTKLGESLYEFFLSICICHSLIVERLSDSEFCYQGPSPDEVALVEAAKQLGFEFKQRSSKHVSLSFHGNDFTFEILNVLEFTSERRKMSVIAKGPDGVIRLFCKGADSAIISSLLNYQYFPDGDDLMKATTESLTNFSCDGLRTLCIANKVLTTEVWEEWDQKYQEASAAMEERESKIELCAQEIETELNLLGITAIEDKLQDGVPETIEKLSSAGIKVFMITGDKQETAISIAISCNLIQDPKSLMICNEPTKEDAKEKLDDFLKDCDQRKYYTSDYLKPERKEMVIDGPTLNQILGTEVERVLAELASKCTTVVVCRASPSQKSAIVEMMKTYQIYSHSKWYATNEKIPWAAKFWNKTLWKIWDGKILAIGDGANDVAMIQSADVGIGISGKEGRQAVNNSDFAISQFRHLGRLLFVHGQLSYYRLAHLIKYSFYKNISFSLCFFFFQFFCGFSGQAIIDSMSATIYNVVLTSLPILILATVDKPAEQDTLLKHPQLYNTSRALSSWNFWKAALVKSTMTAALSFFVPYISASTLATSGKMGTDNIFALGKTVYISLLGIIGIEILLLSRSWTKLFVASVVLSYLFVYLFLPVYEAILKAIPYPMAEYSGIAKVLFSSPGFWLQILLCYLVAFGVRFIDRATKLHMFPDDYDVLAEVDLLDKLQKTNSKRRVSLPFLARNPCIPSTTPEDDSLRESSYNTSSPLTPEQNA